MPGTAVDATELLRHNERTKFLAGVLDKPALAITVAGCLAPAITGTLPGNAQTTVAVFWLLFGTGFWAAPMGYWGN